MDYRYKIGQAVKVREDLKIDAGYRMLSGPTAGKYVTYGPYLDQFKGKIVHIKDYIEEAWCSYYRIEESPNRGALTDEMLEGVNGFFCKSLL